MLLVAAALVAGGGATVVGAAFVALETDWGHARLKDAMVAQVRAALAPGVTLTIGSIDGGVTRAWSLDSVVLADPSGRPVVTIGRIGVGLALPSLARRDVRLGVVTIEGLRATLAQDARGDWNVAALVRKAAGPAAGSAGSPWRISADSVAVRRSTVEIVMPDSVATLPPVRRTLDALDVSLGPTLIASPATEGGSTSLRALSLSVDRPAVRIVDASGTLRWWNDSLAANIAALRLPATTMRATGTIAWPDAQPVRVTADLAAESDDIADLRWASPLVPASGSARARATVRSTPSGDLQFAISGLDVRSAASHLTGRLTVTTGRRPEVRDLALAVAPLDLALVRDIFGDTVLAPAWRGALTGRVDGRGGYLDSLVIDSAAVAFDDARVPGARSTFRVAGAIDLSGAVTRLLAMNVAVDALDIRTTGAVARAADSLRGVLTGRLVLDGPLDDVRFHSLDLRHVDGGPAHTTVRGEGRIASDVRTRWLDAALTLDTIAIATLVRADSALPLRGTPAGRLVLFAVGDTLTIDATLSNADATVRLTGTSLLDTTRTRLDLTGTLTDVDPRAFIARADIPPALLSGHVAISVDERPGEVERHVELMLDSTSRLGDSRLVAGALRIGMDSTGLHVDTADVRAATWSLEARGRLADSGTGRDSLTFRAIFDSLAVMRSIVLDTAGAPLFGEIEGRLRIERGVLTGSVESAALDAGFGASDVRVGTTSVGMATGTVALRDLPHRATGAVRAVASSIVIDDIALDSVSLGASVADGERARVRVRAATTDSIDIRATADVTWPDSVVVARVDTLEAVIRNQPWILASPATVRQRPGGFDLDSIVMTGGRGTQVAVGGSLPEKGAVTLHARVSRLNLEQVPFPGLVPDGMTGVIDGSATITGTRDAPLIAFAAVLDSIRSDDRARGSVSFTGNYADRKASIVLGAQIGGRRALDARGDVPVDLTLRTVEDRVVNAPMSVRVVADSLVLGEFESLVPRARGLAGVMHGDVTIGGTLRQPRGRGLLTLAGGAFDVPRLGVAARGASAEIELAGDSIIVRHVRMTDTDSPRDTASLSGIIRLGGATWHDWTVNIGSVANRFRVMDDPRLASAEADWQLTVEGTLGRPRVTGTVELPYAVFTIGPRGRARRPSSAGDGEPAPGIPSVNGVRVSLGSDVRLRSRDANVQLTGEVELFGSLERPWISGSVYATRGTYRVDLGVIKRTFRVDSGTVIVEGTPDVSPALDIYASYIVRAPDADDITIGAHVYGTTDRPRLDLSSDLGTATAQSEIISYLVFGRSSFGVPRDRGAVGRTATAALVPSLGGFLESTLGAVLPFFSTLQVSTVAAEESQNALSNPIELLNNNYALTGGRQIGSDTFFSITTGRCSGGRLGASSASPVWFGTAAEYRPKRSVGAAISIDPGPAPCSRVSGSGDTYQIGFDLLYAWPFGGRR